MIIKQVFNKILCSTSTQKYYTLSHEYASCLCAHSTLYFKLREILRMCSLYFLNTRNK